MTEPKLSRGKFYIDVILKSAGVEAENRLHSRTFSTNILFTNARELLEALSFTDNPQMMVNAFSVENRQAKKQFHREINRLAHNYLCSVSTFVDHNRNFMNLHYAETNFSKEYAAEVKERFDTFPLARFVRDLRNFMTHRGLPDSKMKLEMKPTGRPFQEQDNGLEVDVKSSVTYGKARLLEWGGWTSPARKFIDEIEDEIALKDIFEPHASLMRDFNEWFIERFGKHHQADFSELEFLREQYEKMDQ